MTRKTNKTPVILFVLRDESVCVLFLNRGALGVNSLSFGYLN